MKTGMGFITFAITALLTLGCKAKKEGVEITLPPPTPPTAQELADLMKAQAPNPSLEHSKAPYAIKNLRMGMSFAEFQATKPNITLIFMSKGVKQYHIDGSIAGCKEGFLVCFADYGEGKVLDQLQFAPEHSDFQQILDAMVSKFGPANSETEDTKSNAMGASFHGKVYKWDNNISYGSAEEVGYELHKSAIHFGYRDPKGRASKDEVANSKKVEKDI